MPLQGEHAVLPDRAKLAYAKLVMGAIGDVKEAFLTTTLRRTAVKQDYVRWPSPLLAFLQEAAWVPVVAGEDVTWARPRDCWYAARSEPMPRFVPRIDRAVREVLDVSNAARELFVKRLSLKLWTDRASAAARLALLGEMLERGVAETEHDSLRRAYREAWLDWNGTGPATCSAERTGVGRARRRGDDGNRVANGAERPPVFIAEGEDAVLENILVSLGHKVLSVPPSVGQTAAAALSAALGGDFLLAAAARPTIIIDGAPLDVAQEAERLTGSGRDWLAEIAVLVLEFNLGFSNRNTVRTRHLLYEAVKRLRMVFARHLQVEIEGRIGELPAELDGVLPVPDSERPTLVIESPAPLLDWPTLARASRGIAAAVDRPWLHTDMRMAFLRSRTLSWLAVVL